MNRVKQFFCLMLCSVVILTTVGSRQRVYGFAATATAAGVVLALAAAAGLTFAAEDSGVIEDSIEQFLTAHPEYDESVNDLITNCYDPLTGSLQIGIEYKDAVMNILKAIYNYFFADESGSGSVTIPADNLFSFASNITFTVDFLKSLPLSSEKVNVSFPPYFVVLDGGGLDNSFFITFFYIRQVSENAYEPYKYTFRFNESSEGIYSLYSHSGYSLGNAFSVGSIVPYFLLNDRCNLRIFTSSNTEYVDFSLFSGGQYTTFYAFNPLFFCARDNDITMKDEYWDGLVFQFSTYLNEAISLLPNDIASFDPSEVVFDYQYVYPQDVTQDVVIGAWEDALSQENKDVILYPLNPDELVGVNGYDVAYGVDGAIEGVDLPEGIEEVPEVPTNPDLSGISGLLASLLSAVKALPETIIGTGSLDLSGFSNLNLTGVFPFCIPFDLINSFQAFNTPPLEPIFRADFTGTAFDSIGVFEIDLTQFDELAQIVRFFAYAFFVLGLIIATRHLIKG